VPDLEKGEAEVTSPDVAATPGLNAEYGPEVPQSPTSQTKGCTAGSTVPILGKSC
jgi:hypothetical protein